MPHLTSAHKVWTTLIPRSQLLKLYNQIPILRRTINNPPFPHGPKRISTGFHRERYEKAVSYSRAGYTLYFISYFLSAVVLLLILRLGIAAKFRDIAEAASDKKWIQCLVFVPLLILLTDLFELPVRVYWHALSLRYQQSIQHWGSWIVDWSKEEALGVGLAVLLVFVLTFAMRKSPRRWWFYFWLAALPILLFFFFISPWFIDPLFNHFEPLAKEHPQLVASIETLTQRAGVPIPRDRMFLMKASEKTNQINAYVTGMGASKRVVIWDTTIQKMSTDEALFILGHELGHYVLGHVAIGFLFFAVSLLLALYVMFRALHWSLQRWGARVENTWTRRLGGYRCAFTMAGDSVIYFFTNRKRLQPHAGTCRRCLRPGSNSRPRPQLRGGSRARVSSNGRPRPLRSKSAGVYYFLALQPSAAGGALGIRTRLRPLV